MFGILKIKALFLGLLLASPPVAAWMLRGDEKIIQETAVQPVTESQRARKVPVEVVSKGSEPEWIYVEVAPQAVPEPGVFALVAIASLGLLRRRRIDGK